MQYTFFQKNNLVAFRTFLFILQNIVFLSLSIDYIPSIHPIKKTVMSIIVYFRVVAKKYFSGSKLYLIVRKIDFRLAFFVFYCAVDMILPYFFILQNRAVTKLRKVKQFRIALFLTKRLDRPPERLV